MPRATVEAVVLDTKDTEAGEVIAKLRELRRKLRCRWSDCAVLYRTHVNRDQLAAEMVRQSIPFAIENMDVMDTPQARDLLACLGAVVSGAGWGASLGRGRWRISTYCVMAIGRPSTGPHRVSWWALAYGEYGRVV